MRRAHRWLAAAIGLLLLAGCITTPRLHKLREGSRLAGRPAQLKVHLRSGDLLVLNTWQESDSALVGRGSRYGLDRELQHHSDFVMPFDSIALLETSTTTVTGASVGVTLMAVWTALLTAVTVQCVSDPKSCFGSCPTFYITDGDREVLQAEGFSASIARVLEARDVDALFRARPTERRLTVRMTNEALETHAVRTVRILAAPRPPAGRVLAGKDGRFYPAIGFLAPLQCRGADGDCLTAVTAMDTLERRSTSDSSDLATREILELEFPPMDAGPRGLAIGARQSLVSTFLFYQTMGYLGRRAGEWLADLERADPQRARMAMGMEQSLGGIEVLVPDTHGEWLTAGTFDEPGPIATDVAVIPLPANSAPGPFRVRLRMARGVWRVNYLALARLDAPVRPDTLEPQRVERDGLPDPAALRALRDPHRYLVTYPGADYHIEFTLPVNPCDWELFLESQGHYYEWMRAEWLADEDPEMAALVLGQPRLALRVLAPSFKRHEARMERLFWESRYGR